MKKSVVRTTGTIVYIVDQCIASVFADESSK